MADQHEAFCDENHTPRQACNRNLAVAPEGVIVSPPEAPPAPARPPATPAEIPASSIVIDDEVIIDEDEPRAAIATEEMPAPSPWASRAWEDTAAAVGASASPAPEPADLHDELEQKRGGRGHLLLLTAILASTVLVALFVIRRRAG